MSFIIDPYRFGSGPTSPDQVPGLLRWYKADTFALADSTAIGGTGNEWIDQSPAGEDAVQASAPSRPLFRTGIFGAMPAIEFVTANSTFLTMTAVAIPLNFTVIIIGKVANHTPALSSFVSANIHCTIFPGSVNILSFQSGSDGAASSAFSGAQTSLRMMTWRRLTPGNVSFREQNISRGTTLDIAGDNPFSFDIIGANILAQYSAAHFAEICVFDEYASDSVIDALLTNYFRVRFPGLP